MGKFLVFTFLFFISSISYSQKTGFSDILKELGPPLSNSNQQSNSKTYYVEDVLTTEFVINSSINASFFGGKDRDTVKLKLPPNTEKLGYRITVLDKNSSFKFLPNEGFYYLLKHRITAPEISTNGNKINVYLFSHSGYATSFIEKKQFTYIPQYTVLNTNSFYGECSYEENLWLGIQNLSERGALKIILEVVAFTNQDNKESITKLIADTSREKIVTDIVTSDKKIKEAKELLDLGLITKDAYNIIVDKFTPPLTREQALEKLRAAKKLLDSGGIKQAEYDELRKKLGPIILEIKKE